MKYLFLGILVFFAACGPGDHNQDTSKMPGEDSLANVKDVAPETTITLIDKTVKFLWRENTYNETIKDSVSSIIINEGFCKTITDPEKAALGYVATFIGNECSWDGPAAEGRSNLKCKILTALNLGYQCSEQQLGFLRKMFQNDSDVLKELQSDRCPTTPDGATIQDTFDEISLTGRGNEIEVSFKVSGVNMREGASWSWAETDYFQVDKDHIRLIKKDRSRVDNKKLGVSEGR